MVGVIILTILPEIIFEFARFNNTINTKPFRLEPFIVMMINQTLKLNLIMEMFDFG